MVRVREAMSGRLCPDCGVFTSLLGGRCAKHRRASNARERDPFYSSRAWVALSTSVIVAHRGQFGDVCPGDGPEHPRHPSRDLTADHIVSRVEGGAPLDRANLRVLCRSRNGSLGAQLVNERRAGKTPPKVPLVLDERAQIRARFLG